MDKVDRGLEGAGMRPLNQPEIAAVGAKESRWDRAWAEVPVAWREPSYLIDEAPANAVFTQNRNYPAGHLFDFAPDGPERFAQETAWWVHTCWSEGLRKIEPSMLRWWQNAVSSIALRHQNLGRNIESLTDIEPAHVVRTAMVLFNRRNGRFPSKGNTRNLTSIAEHIHLYLASRTTDAPWWEADVWSLKADPRIPRREHEPSADKPAKFTDASPLWFRDGLRYYLSRTLIYQHFAWTTLLTRARSLQNYFGRFLQFRAINTPVLAEDPEQLRSLCDDLISWLRSPEASSSDKPLSNNTVAAIQSAVQGFYDYLYDTSNSAASFTGDERWSRLGPQHTRLWAPTQLVKTRSRLEAATPRYLAAEDLTAMAACIPILQTPTDRTITVEPVGREKITVRGLGDPQAARAWLLQAATGRRASEVLMLDFNCLTPIPGLPATTEPGSFIARLRYQQTKVAGIDPVILVEDYVVQLIRAQQAWVRQHLDLHEHDTDPGHLFINPRQNYRGLQPRSYSSYSRVLSKLNSITRLTDEHGNKLNFTSTHRLRHTRATTLLNAGVPIHVVQDYMGHRSPEMTMHYAKTLASVAEQQFLDAAATGAFGKPLEIGQADVYKIAQMEGRTDRILPHGLCLLPPTQTCTKGNACLSCSSFATDASHLKTLQQQRKVTVELVTDRQKIVQARHGREMGSDNAWLKARNQEIDSLDKIIEALSNTTEIVKNPGSTRGPTPDPRTPEDPQ